MSLSPRLLILAGLLAIAAAAAQWAGDSAWRQAWLFPAGLLVLLVAVELLLTSRYRFALSRVTPSAVELGRELTLGYQLRVLPARRFSLELAEALPAQLSEMQWQARFEMPNEGVLAFERPLTALSLGEMQFNTLQARVLGVFGLVWWRRTLPAAARTCVVPQSLTQAERRQFTRAQGEVAQQRSVGQGLELIAIRDYQAGDPPRSIDWKASARSGNELKVRVLSVDQNLELTILLDVGRRSRLVTGQMRRLDHYVNLCSRLAQVALSANDTVHVLAYAQHPVAELYHLRGQRGIQRLHRTLSGLSVQAGDSDPSAAASVVLRRLPRRTLLVCLGDTESPPTVQSLLRALHLLRRKHLPLVACLDDPELLALTRAQSDHWRAPARLLAAQELLHAQHAANTKLRSMGAIIVSADPEHLDARVLGAYADLRRRRAV